MFFVRPWARRVGLPRRFRPSLLLVLFVGVARSFARLLRIGGVVFAVPAAGGLLGGRDSVVRPPVLSWVTLLGLSFVLVEPWHP